MQNLIAESTNKANPEEKPRKFSDQLHLRYGKIGISAVAAAARYQGGAKNPAYAPAAPTKWRDIGEEVVAA